jgi:riboflavin transporter FmnP
VPGNPEARISLVIAISTVFGAFSAVLAMMPLSFSFPLIPYLKFDIAEIPVVTAFLGFGPVPGFISALTYWLVLNIFGEWTPIGPAMKFIAVASMLVGLWVSYKLMSRFRMPYISVFIFSSLLRVLATTACNYLVLVVIMPFFLEFAVKSLSIALGLEIEVGLGGLLLILAFTAIYNILHVALSLLPSIFLVRNLSKQGLFLNLREPWLLQAMVKKRPRDFR